MSAAQSIPTPDVAELQQRCADYLAVQAATLAGDAEAVAHLLLDIYVIRPLVKQILNDLPSLSAPLGKPFALDCISRVRAGGVVGQALAPVFRPARGRRRA